ncbi:leishmanolysin-like [Bactrocera neohumeralis]|uniref:leishmanolysin-like n=1 Tax=Bactrocera neohumeralis TaxID=98809 RepID=UPI0021665A1C|nr:leishmanolysin-like [Bactrocera neohumeralis]
MEFVELEDQGDEGSVGSHWKMRNAKDELMSPVAGMGVYTAMTISAMEDMGFYKGNYTNAEEMTWGKNAGCTLLEEKCIVNETSMEPSMFCTTNSIPGAYLCPSDRTGLGTALSPCMTKICLPTFSTSASQPKVATYTWTTARR